jgi:hypothetical protein
MTKKITYNNIEELIGSVWMFPQSINNKVRLEKVDKAKSKLTGKVLTFSHITLDKPNFETNEFHFERDFLVWAERIK